MKIVITGGGGYLGSRLSLYLTEKGHQVIAVCSSKIPQKEGWTELISQFIIGDIREEATIKRIASVHAEAIIHLISLDHHDSEKAPSFVSEVNVQPTWNLLDLCLSEHPVKKFIYFSTIHVYGKTQKDLVLENQKVTPFNAYGLTHALSEEICNYYHRKTDTDCLNIRLSNSYGEPVFYNAKCWDLIVNDLSKSAYLDKKIVLKGDGKAIRDFIHFSDICEGVASLIEGEINIGDENTFQFSSSKSIRMLDVAIKVKEVYRKKYDVEIPIFINSTEEWVSEKAIHMGNNSISNSLAKKHSIEFVKDLKEGIENIFTYLETEPWQK
jgi:UDP-glucose 4-epimerase